MGREIKRVPMDFDFPLGKSYYDAKWAEHEVKCNDPNEHDDCDVSCQPPKGDGWQLWQTVSDGPISPVFATPEELIDFMSTPDPSRAGRMPWAQGYERETAERFVRGPGWAPSMVMMGGVLMSGVDAITKVSK